MSKCCIHCVPPKRHPACHSTCPERLAELEALAEEKAKIKAEREKLYAIDDYNMRRAERRRRRIGRKND